jgi:diguanylate cyclase (GGDEF)-like protein
MFKQIIVKNLGRLHALSSARLYLNKLILILALLCPAEQSWAKKTLYNFSNVSQQLASKELNILKLIQDPQGFIWLATQNGLLRYDGYEFKTYLFDIADPYSLPDNYVITLHLDQQGRLWIGSRAGLARYEPEQDAFIRYQHQADNGQSLSHNMVMDIIDDQQGGLWIASFGGGLNHFNPSSGQFDVYRHDPNNNQSISDDRLYSLMLDKQGVLWVGTRTGGLNSLEIASGKFTRYQHQDNQSEGISHNRIYALLEDVSGHIWVGTRGGGLNRFDRKTGHFQHFRYNQHDSNSLGSDHVFDIFQDQQDTIWVGTSNGGLNRLDAQGLQFDRYQHDSLNHNSLAHNNVFSMFQDDLGIIWLGLFGGGLSKFSPDDIDFGFTQNILQQKNSLSGGKVNSIYKDQAGIVWTGTDLGLNRYDPQRDEYRFFSHDPDRSDSLAPSNVQAIFEDAQARLWIGTLGGLSQLSAAEKGQSQPSFIHYHNKVADPRSLSDDAVLAITQDNSGKLWVGTEQGLNRFDPIGQNFTRYLYQSGVSTGLSNNSINTLYPAKDGSLWVGTVSGLNHFLPQSEQFVQYYIYPDKTKGLAHDRIFSITEDAAGKLWLGTMAGLHYFDPKDQSIKSFPELSNATLAVLLDDQSGIWLAGDEISRLDLNTGQIKKYMGAGAGCGAAAQGASFKASDGQMFFGGNGYCAFYPDKVMAKHQAPAQPNIVFTDFRLLNKSVVTSRKTKTSPLSKAIDYNPMITLKHTDNILSFEFAALDYVRPNNNQYRYKLVGFNDQWIETSASNRRATYTNLPSGEYSFVVIASNSQGVWNEQGRIINLTILPAPWRTWWAYMGYALLLALIVFAFWREQTKQISLERKMNHELELQVKTRTGQLEEKNQELQRAFAEIEQVSMTDQLTGAHNRRFFNQNIDHQLALLKREYFNLKGAATKRLGFLLIDADHFKKVNDSYGHDAGDQMLQQLVAVVKKTCRNTDWVIRWGGEEFLVAGLVEKQDELHILAERIRHNIEQYAFSIGNGQTTKQTCSIGLTYYPFIQQQFDALTWQETLNLADIALFKAKDQGRNIWISLFEDNITDHEEFYEQTVSDINSQIQQGRIAFSSSVNHQDIRW